MPKKEAPLKEKNGPPEEKKGPPEMTYGSQIYHGSPKVLRGTQGDVCYSWVATFVEKVLLMGQNDGVGF